MIADEGPPEAASRTGVMRQANRCHGRGARPLALCQAGRRRHARHGPGGRGHRLRRLHRAHRRRGEAPAGRDRGAAQFHQSPAARGLVGRGDQAGANPADAREHRLSRPSVRAAARRAGRGGRDAPPAALSGGRRLRRHEHHAAVGVGVVGQCHRHHAGDARFLPLGLGADRTCRRRPMPAGRSS